MSRKHYHLLCALPGLTAFGMPPPFGKSAFAAMVRECRGPEPLVQTLLLADDLIQREGVLCGEIDMETDDFAVLSVSQATGDAPLPPYLTADAPEDNAGPDNPLATDSIWGRYFRHAADRARRLGSPFLAHWVAHEVGLRNALARVRAETLGLDARPYLVAEKLGEPYSAFDRELDEWKRAPHPLAGLEAMERLRWNWLREQAPWYDFGDDEVAAYGAGLMVLLRRQRMLQDGG